MDKIEAELLTANSAFYGAFLKADYKAMDALWARVAPVCCIHPGWPPIHGRDAVMSTWQGVLKRPSQIKAFGERAIVLGDVGVVIGFESLGNVSLVATNVFMREEGLWKMIHHQAGVAEHARNEIETAKNRSQLH